MTIKAPTKVHSGTGETRDRLRAEAEATLELLDEMEGDEQAVAGARQASGMPKTTLLFST